MRRKHRTKIVATLGPASTKAEQIEALFMAGLAAQAPLDHWFVVWEKINYLVARTDSLNLDRKQIILDAFLGLENMLKRG